MVGDTKNVIIPTSEESKKIIDAHNYENKYYKDTNIFKWHSDPRYFYGGKEKILLNEKILHFLQK